tara:strand:- start:285 stop:650 length:366 start_codon:yes stop_codon:yes gene_type:complete
VAEKKKYEPSNNLVIFNNRDRQKKWDADNNYEEGSFLKGRPPAENAKLKFEVDLKDHTGKVIVYAGTELEIGVYIAKDSDGKPYKKGRVSATNPEYKKLTQTYAPEPAKITQTTQEGTIDF